jgi:hypothetical protein
MCTHFRHPRTPVLAACASGRRRHETTASLTANRDLVTCKRCLALLAKAEGAAS